MKKILLIINKKDGEFFDKSIVEEFVNIKQGQGYDIEFLGDESGILKNLLEEENLWGSKITSAQANVLSKIAEYEVAVYVPGTAKTPKETLVYDTKEINKNKLLYNIGNMVIVSELDKELSNDEKIDTMDKSATKSDEVSNQSMIADDISESDSVTAEDNVDGGAEVKNIVPVEPIVDGVEPVESVSPVEPIAENVSPVEPLAESYLSVEKAEEGNSNAETSSSGNLENIAELSDQKADELGEVSEDDTESKNGILTEEVLTGETSSNENLEDIVELSDQKADELGEVSEGDTESKNEISTQEVLDAGTSVNESFESENTASEYSELSEGDFGYSQIGHTNNKQEIDWNSISSGSVVTLSKEGDVGYKNLEQNNVEHTQVHEAEQIKTFEPDEVSEEKLKPMGIVRRLWLICPWIIMLIMAGLNYEYTAWIPLIISIIALIVAKFNKKSQKRDKTPELMSTVLILIAVIVNAIYKDWMTAISKPIAFMGLIMFIIVGFVNWDN